MYNLLNTRTVKSWKSLLEASYIIFLLQPYYKSYGNKITKSPKLYFYDTGVACNLLKIRTVKGLKLHYLFGGLFECYVITDFIKQHCNAL
jgi:uncharacterized protein